MSDLISFNPVRALDANGNPVAGARAFFYTSGTTTPVTVFSDAAEQTPHPSPLLADAEGVFPPVFRSGQPIKVDVQTPGGESLNGFPLDPVLTAPASGAAASQVSFEPTENIPGTNVQAAIERVQENLVTDALNTIKEIKEAAARPALATTGDGAAYVLDPGADLRREALDVYDQYVFRANSDSTGAVTLDVTLADSTTGAIAVERYVGDTLTALAAGDLIEGHHYAVQYDGAVWVLLTQLSAPSLSEAQATDPDDTTFGTVSGQRLGQAVAEFETPNMVKAWVHFNSEGEIQGSSNVSSITKLGTGRWQVNFAVDMPNANYAAISMCFYGGTATRFHGVDDQLVGSCVVRATNDSRGYSDTTLNSLIVAG